MSYKYKNFKNTVIEILIKISVIVLPLLLICNFLFDSAYNHEIKKSKERISAGFFNKTDVFEKMVQSLFNEVFQDITIIKNSDEFSAFQKNNNSENMVEARKLFERYMVNKEDYFQLRFIDAEGKEVIRVDRVNNTILPIPDNKLQNKKDRYYFKKSIDLGGEEIYISNLDLNIEFGEIVEPHQPAIRFSSPVVNEKKDTVGVLVFNYKGQKFLDIFNDYFKDNDQLSEIFLIDNDGYYLSCEDQNKNFGFMFDGDSQNYTLKKEFPEIWKSMASFRKNSIETGDSVFYFRKIVPEFKWNTHFDKENLYWSVLNVVKKKDIPVLYQNIFLFKRNIRLYILGTVLLISSTIITILHLKKRDNMQLNLIKLILGYVDEAVLIADADKNIVGLNGGFTRLTGHPREEVLNVNIKRFRDKFADIKLYEEIEEQLVKGESWARELWLKKKDGSNYPANLTVKKIINPKNKKTEYYLYLIKNLSFEKEKDEEIEYLLTHHSKTKLPNEVLFYKLIDEEIKNNDKFSIIYIKLKNYENLQIKYNEEFMDLIYKHIIQQIQSLIKNKGDIAHLSKDTFITISKIYTEKHLLNRSLVELSNKLKSNLVIKDKNIKLDFEFGVVIFPDHGNSSEELLKKSIYSVNSLKYYPDRNYLIYQDNLENKIKREIDIEEYLIKAVENNEFELYFQPQINSIKNTLIGLEALIRWNSPILGMVSPTEFIPIAEETGIINRIGMWVVEEAAKKTKLLGLDKFKNIKVSINLSASEFKNKFLVEDITYILNIYDIDFKQFEIELTEGVLVSDYGYVKSKLDEFQANGISVSIDDFGTGFSSMSYLKKLRFDKIKIDREFIKDYPESDNGAMAEFITYMAKKLNVQVIAEGVENEEQVKYLQSIGCGNIQGYYYSKPLSCEELKKYLEKYIGCN